MFYRPGRDPHGLGHDPFKALVAPRPIGWISTRDGAGRDNLAPYSFFNAVGSAPPTVMFSTSGAKPDGEVKDSLRAIRETGVFAANMAGWALREAMVASSAHLPAGADEFAATGLAKAACREIDCPRVAAAPAALECRLFREVALPGPGETMVIGEVVGVHIDEAILAGGRADVTRWRPMARLGYADYAVVERVFAMARP